jgi:hypothetical protein
MELKGIKGEELTVVITRDELSMLRFAAAMWSSKTSSETAAERLGKLYDQMSRILEEKDNVKD